MKDANIDGIVDKKVRTGELTKKIWHRFGAGWVKLTQVRAATGYADLNTADMMVMGEWPSTGNVLHGFEVKVSRADWLNEVKNPHKNDSVKSYCDHWWLVIADENMVREGELPEDWGMMVYDGPGRKLKIVKKAPKLEPQPMDNLFVASLLRHNDKESISKDLHNECIKDVRLDAAAHEKAKNADLYKFISHLRKSLGIVIKEHKSTDFVDGTYRKVYQEWLAEIKGSWLGEVNGEKLAKRMKIAYDIEQMVSHVEWANKNMVEVLAELPQDGDSRFRVWLEWAIKDSNKIIEQFKEFTDE